MGGITRTNFGCTAKRTLTAAELIAAFAGGNQAIIEMVPARNAVYYVPFAGAVRVSWNADFTNIDGGAFCEFSVKDPGDDSVPIAVFSGFAEGDDIFAPGGSILAPFGITNNSTIWGTSGVEVLPIGDYANAPINFIIDNVAAGPFTGGGISTIELTCFYLAL